MNLKQKVVLVTGASQGIGRAIVLAFAREGATVVANYRRTKPEFQSKAVTCIRADVSHEDEVHNLFNQTIEKFGTVDILVNNAAASKIGNFSQADLGLWQQLFHNNVMSAVICSQRFAQLNIDAFDKKIINIGSLYGYSKHGDASMMEYSASKAALHSFTLTLAKLLAPNILVTGVAPGFTLTPQWRKRSEEFKQQCIESTLIKRFIQPEEVADAVLFLARNDAMAGTMLQLG